MIYNTAAYTLYNTYAVVQRADTVHVACAWVIC